MITAAVRATLRAQLDVAIRSGLVARENEEFDPPSRKPWIRERLLPGIPERIELGKTGGFRTYGVYRIDVFSPAGEGTSVAESIADTLAAAFVAGTGYGSGPTVWVRRTYTQAAIQDGTWYQVPVSVDWMVNH
jgi:hypothetical protein